MTEFFLETAKQLDWTRLEISGGVSAGRDLLLSNSNPTYCSTLTCLCWEEGGGWVRERGDPGEGWFGREGWFGGDRSCRIGKGGSTRGCPT